MKSYARPLYSSQQWKKCRAAYLKNVGGLCEICLAKGIFRSAEIVHHKIFIDESNYNDPEIALNFKYLQAVCRQCHEEIHNNKIFLPKPDRKRRYDITVDGSVIMYDE